MKNNREVVTEIGYMLHSESPQSMFVDINNHRFEFDQYTLKSLMNVLIGVNRAYTERKEKS